MSSEISVIEKVVETTQLKICDLLRQLTGQKAEFDRQLSDKVDDLLSGSGVGYSQFNEMLLLLGYDRVSPSFFRFLIDGDTEYVGGEAFASLEDMGKGIDRFRKLAILNYGNVKFGFKYLSSFTTNLHDEIERIGPVDEEIFKQRHDPLWPVDVIAAEKTYYLGYLIERQLKLQLEENPNNPEVLKQLREREEIVSRAKRNQDAYLTSDHMDVYVATSMRERHEYQIINEVVRDVFSSDALAELKVRWFDPTQAYCADRIDKGLSEALMLKRAFCTLYLAQESDTFGKDSELASTLAQGKPVVAYIPRFDSNEIDSHVESLLKMVALSHPDATEAELILGQLKVFNPKLAWKDSQVQSWLADINAIDITKAKRRLGVEIIKHYDKRADTLKHSHPLGIQVHLQTGVANGVLVARTPLECATLIRQILTRTLEFEVEEKIVEGVQYLMLIEAATGSVFRVMTGDRFLTNAFWNFYLD
ncbi:hypothetical protein JD969_08355 [Planctomycetota bacterium]|nr:hypothetical protein JD969_08355 [Planctomycetota bacterium]